MSPLSLTSWFSCVQSGDYLVKVKGIFNEFQANKSLNIFLLQCSLLHHGGTMWWENYKLQWPGETEETRDLGVSVRAEWAAGVSCLDWSFYRPGWPRPRLWQHFRQFLTNLSPSHQQDSCHGSIRLILYSAADKDYQDMILKTAGLQ